MSKRIAVFAALMALHCRPFAGQRPPPFPAWPRRRSSCARTEGGSCGPGESRRGEDSLLPGPHAPLVSLRQAGDRAGLRHEAGAGLCLRGGGSAEARGTQDSLLPGCHEPLASLGQTRDRAGRHEARSGLCLRDSGCGASTRECGDQFRAPANDGGRNGQGGIPCARPDHSRRRPGGDGRDAPGPRPRENQRLDQKGLRRLHVAASEARRSAVHVLQP